MTYRSNRRESVARAAIRAVGQLWAISSRLKSNILINLLKNKTMASTELNEEIIMSICNYLSSLKTEEQLQKNSPMVAMLTTLYQDINGKEAQLKLMTQFFRFGVGHSPLTLDTLTMHYDRDAETHQRQFRQSTQRHQATCTISLNRRHRDFVYIY